MEFPYTIACFSGEENSITLSVGQPETSPRGGIEPEFPGTLLLETSLFHGENRSPVAFEDVDEWEHVLMRLSAGQDVVWREFGRGIEIAFYGDEGGEDWWVVLKDQSYRVKASVLVSIDEAWLAGARTQLEQLKEYIRTA